VSTPPAILSVLLGALATPGATPTRRVVRHSRECGAHPHCEGECMPPNERYERAADAAKEQG
jgi:hypothetical protein